MRRNKRADFPVDPCHKAGGLAHIALDLGIEPETRRLPEETAQPQGGIQRVGSLAVNDLVHPACRNPQGASERVLRETHRLHIFLQQDFPRSDVVKIGFAHDGLMVIDDLNLVRVSVAPDKADAPLVVDADAVRSGSSALEGFEPVTRRHPQILQMFRLVEPDQFAQGDALDFSRQFSRRDFQPNLLSLLRAERLDHSNRL